MKIRIALLTAFALSLTRWLSAVSGPVECLPYTIRVEYTYSRQEGTVVAPHIILTHNHFDPKPRPDGGEIITLVECSGKSTTLAVERLQFIGLNEGSALIFLPQEVVLEAAPLADAQTLTRLAPGARVSVNYWDDATRRLAFRDFEVLQVTGTIATLADPQHLINPGDSGGGTFLEGRLVGNTWARHIDANGLPTGLFDVALLPMSVQGLQAQAKFIEQAELP